MLIRFSVECFGLRKVNDVASQFILRQELRMDDLHCEISQQLQALYAMEVFKEGDCDPSECRTHMVLEAVYGYFWPKMAIKKKRRKIKKKLALLRMCSILLHISQQLLRNVIWMRVVKGHWDNRINQFWPTPRKTGATSVNYEVTTSQLTEIPRPRTSANHLIPRN